MHKTTLRILTLLIIAAICYAFTPAKRTITIFMIGDSTMADKKIDQGSPERGWGMVLKGFFTDDVVIDNHAVNGRSSKSFIDEGRWQKVLDKIQPGDYVVIQFGHNDEKPAVERHTDPGTTFDANLERFVNETRSKDGNPILMNAVVRRSFYRKPEGPDGANLDDESLRDTPYGVSEKINSDTLVPTHGDYVIAPRNVAKNLNVPFVDATSISHRMETEHGIEGSRKLHVWLAPGEVASIPDGRQDNTHYSIYGAHTIASLLVDAMGKEVPALKRHIRHYDYIVSAQGRGNYMTLQAAIDAVPEGKKATISILDGEWQKPATKKKIKYVVREGATLK